MAPPHRKPPERSIPICSGVHPCGGDRLRRAGRSRVHGRRENRGQGAGRREGLPGAGRGHPARPVRGLATVRPTEDDQASGSCVPCCSRRRSRCHQVGCTLIRDVGLHRTLSFDPMLFFNELLVHLGIPTGSSDEAHASRLSVVASRSNGLTCSGHDSPGMDSFLRCQDPVFLGTAEHEALYLRGWPTATGSVRRRGSSACASRRSAVGSATARSDVAHDRRPARGSGRGGRPAPCRTARDPTAPAHTSRRNAFPGVITKVTRDKVSATVEIQAGPYRVVS